MKDQRLTQFADLMLDYSINLREGERVLIEGVYARRAYPFAQLHDDGIRRKLIKGSGNAGLKKRLI